MLLQLIERGWTRPRFLGKFDTIRCVGQDPGSDVDSVLQNVKSVPSNFRVFFFYKFYEKKGLDYQFLKIYTVQLEYFSTRIASKISKDQNLVASYNVSIFMS